MGDRIKLSTYVTSMDRNNTNFPIQLFEYFKSLKWNESYDFLRYYQNIVREFVTRININSRGLLICHQMGYGKSMLAIAIAIELMSDLQPILLIAKSLQPNMRGAIKKYIVTRAKTDPTFHLARLDDSETEKWIDAHFAFVSMNAGNMLTQLDRTSGSQILDLETKMEQVTKLPSLEGKLLIIDEAHNIFRAITNGSKNGIGLYDAVMKAKNLKCVFLTGTPVVNDPFEVVPCFNMLSGGIPLLPEDYKEFGKLFKSDKNINNKEKFQNRIMGLVSCIGKNSEFGKAIGLKIDSNIGEFPEEKPLIVEHVPMTNEQYMMYQLARDKEMDEGGGGGNAGFSGKKSPIPQSSPAMTKPTSKVGSTYRVKSRQLSNYCAPPNQLTEKDPMMLTEVSSPKFEKIYENIEKNPNKLGLVYSQFTGVGGLGTFARFLDKKGWKCHNENKSTAFATEPELPRDDDVAPTKEEQVKDKTGSHDASHESSYPSANKFYFGSDQPPTCDYIDQIERDAYNSTWWKGSDESEMNFADTFTFDLENDSHSINGGTYLPTGAAETKHRSYAIISGNVPIAERARIIEMMVSPENKHGELCELLLVSATGAEGLDLKNIRFIYIMEPYWNLGRVLQIIARGVRNDSHSMLPANEKTVQAYIYLAVPPGSSDVISTTDTELYESSLVGQKVIDSFVEAICETSIECILNGESKCRVCNPTNEKLFTNDPSADVRNRDPCSQVTEKNITVQKVIVDGVEYNWEPFSDSVFGIRVFVFDDHVKRYKVLPEHDERFQKIADKVSP